MLPLSRANPFSGFAVAILATILELGSLVEMMSNGTLMVYTLATVSIFDFALSNYCLPVGLSKDSSQGYTGW
jgi:hypothetical protein